MKYMPATFALVLVALLSVVGAVIAPAPANAQGLPPAPTNIRAVDGQNPGDVVVNWNAVPQASVYRVGWIVLADYNAAISAGHNWLEAFVFVDVDNRGQSQHTVARLQPGVEYYFIVGSAATRFGDANWPASWSPPLTVRGADCPTQSTTPPAPGGSVASDRAALVALYDSTNGNAWTNSTAWLSNRPLNEWYGITTNDAGRVTQINLLQNNLTGPLPTELATLTALIRLQMAGNQLTGAIPSALGSLSRLEYLSLGGNRFSGPIPLELANLSQLEVLSVAGNQLTGNISRDFTRLRNLRELYAQRNMLSGLVQPHLGEMTSLRRLYLGGNQFILHIPEELGNLSNLEQLYLDNNQLSGDVPSSFANLRNLQHLGLHANILSGEIPSFLGRLPLTDLYLGGNRWMGCIPRNLIHVPNHDFPSLHISFCP